MEPQSCSSRPYTTAQQKIIRREHDYSMKGTPQVRLMRFGDAEN
jgi:hypothetical protein